MFDLDSSFCSPQCERLCKAPCVLEKFWKEKFESKTEPFSRLQDGERNQVEVAISNLPKALRSSSLKAIVRASGNAFIGIAGGPAVSSDEYIILFPTAFNKPESIERILAHELVHFLEAHEWAAQFATYKKISGWEINNPRKGEFVTQDSKDSPEEDFAKNIEFYLFDPTALKKSSPELFKWIDDKFRALLHGQKECSDVKR